ncbi:helix-turn-helix transcriptional regulator [Paraburkholderia bannensis]|uniref:helix-turn-helix transcriptional regulator n=1 Tax=Paraburkholderia bannensis TaxID=765414 RepID=UPI002AB60214|nr:helix-turn-helix transcriptional regulator [Paraburkholderia bannensis]
MQQLSLDITLPKLHAFAEIVQKLEELSSSIDLRRLILEDVNSLLDSDFGASFVWDNQKKSFVDPHSVNLDAEFHRRYSTWYQYKDPITTPLALRRSATIVDEVISRSRFESTEFYQDFLYRAGLHHGINLYIYDGSRHLCDFRLWRTKDRPEFSHSEKCLLDALVPFFRKACLRRRAETTGLTVRENEIAQLVARGYTDQDIGRLLSLGVTTIRTHLRNVMEKKSFANRAELAAFIVAQRVTQ